MTEYSSEQGSLQVLHQYPVISGNNNNNNNMHTMHLPAASNANHHANLVHHHQQQHTPPSIDTTSVDNNSVSLDNHHHHHHQQQQLHHSHHQHELHHQMQLHHQHHHPTDHQDGSSNSNNTQLSPSDVSGSERCRFCGQDLPMDAFTVVAHFNSHWRQYSLEAVNPCLYDSHSMVDRISNQQFMQHNPNNDHSANDQVNGSNHLIDHHTGVIHSHQSNSFPYSYSPQTEPSNLSIPGNHLKCPENEPTNVTVNNSCLESEPSNLSVHTVSNPSSQEDTSNLRIPNESSHSSVVCSNVLGMSSPHHNLDSPGALVTGNRCSPLNLTGRPKLVPSPIVPPVNMNGNGTSSLTPIEHPCIMHTENNINPNIQATQPINFTAHLSNGNQIPDHVQPYTNNYPFSSNYFSSHYPYNGHHQQLSSEPPSCRMQNFSQNLENVGLSIPILSPNLGSVQREDSEQCLDPENSPNNGANIPISNNKSISNNLPLTPPSTIILSSCKHSHPHPSVNLHSQVNTTEHSIDNNENKGGTPPLTTQHNCDPCIQSVSNKIDNQNNFMLHVNTNKNFIQNTPDDCSPSDITHIQNSPCHSFQTNSEIIPLKNCGQLQPEIIPKPYKCSICNEEFSIKEELRNHFQGHEAAKPFHCDTCGLGVSNHRALKRHKLTHTGYKPYKCDTCGKSFLQKHDLNRHMNVHERPKYFTCEQCKRIFTAISSYKSHKCKGAKEVRPFLCHICGDGCSNRLAWSYHMWKHTKNPMFVPFQDNIVQEGTR